MPKVPESLDKRVRQAASYLELGAVESARELLESLEAPIAETREARLLLAETYERSQDLPRAESILRALHEKYPSDVETVLFLARLIDSRESRSLLLEVYAAYPRDPRILSALTDWAYRHQDPQLGANYAETWATLYPENIDAIISVGRALEAFGKTTEALNILDPLFQARVLTPFGFEVLIELTLQEAKGQWNESVTKLFTDALQLYPNSSDILLIIARRLKELSQLEMSRQVLEIALKQAPSEEIRHELRAMRGAAPKAVNSKQIVFVSMRPGGRMLKIAHGLRTQGFDLVLLYLEESNDQSWKSFFTESRRCANPEEALLVAEEYRPLLFHVFSSMADDLSVAFVREKPGCVVFDGYDFCEGMIRSDYSERMSELQRFCMEHADGLTCRDLRCRYLFRKQGYRKPKYTIFYPDYCWNEPQLTERISVDEIHVVAAGFVATNRSAEEDWGHLTCAKNFAEQGIHFHIYPNPIQMQPEVFESSFADFINFSKENPFFHFHLPVAMTEVQKEISRYHFGLNVLWPLTLGKEMPMYSREYHALCSSARNIEYLDAGLITILNRRLNFQYWLFDRKGVAVDGSLEFFKNSRAILSQMLKDEELAGKLAKARADYSISRNIPRLINFYQTVARSVS